MYNTFNFVPMASPVDNLYPYVGVEEFTGAYTGTGTPLDDDATVLRDVFTPDVIEDLMLHDFDEPSQASYCTHPRPEARVADPHVIEDPQALVDSVIEPHLTLSEYGKTIVSEWITLFRSTNDPESLIRLYPEYATQFRDFFVKSVPRFDGPIYILDIIEKICSPSIEEPQISSGAIGEWENDTLEYLGGYCLRKARRKFPRLSILPILEAISADEPHGLLIPRMERKLGALMYPSEDCMLFFQHVYMKFTCEASRQPTQINFNSTTAAVLHGQYCSNFIRRIANLCEEECEEREIKLVVWYIVDLLVRVLSYSFARKLFVKLAKNVEKCRGLRTELKKKKSK